jgi:hypothetical protein
VDGGSEKRTRRAGSITPFRTIDKEAEKEIEEGMNAATKFLSVYDMPDDLNTLRAERRKRPSSSVSPSAGRPMTRSRLEPRRSPTERDYQLAGKVPFSFHDFSR